VDDAGASLRRPGSTKKNQTKMKKIIYILAACLMAWIVMPQTTSAQELRKNGSLVGKVTSDGKVWNKSGSQIGKFTSDGKVWNKSGSQIGTIDSNGSLRIRNVSGKVDSNGKVWNGSGQQIGTIDSNGKVWSKSGSQIGTASGVKKTYAAAFLFFNAFN
jgi:hypothetical protein